MKEFLTHMAAFSVGLGTTALIAYLMFREWRNNRIIRPRRLSDTRPDRRKHKKQWNL